MRFTFETRDDRQGVVTESSRNCLKPNEDDFNLHCCGKSEPSSDYELTSSLVRSDSQEVRSVETSHLQFRIARIRRQTFCWEFDGKVKLCCPSHKALEASRLYTRISMLGKDSELTNKTSLTGVILRKHCARPETVPNSFGISPI
jgi:hypothetical protein